MNRLCMNSVKSWLLLACLLLLTGVAASCRSQGASGNSWLNGAADRVDVTAQSKATCAVPLRQVDLFANGLGFFQYQGTVRSSASDTLYFRSGQINDVLKSLVFQDTGGGRVGEALFPTQQPLDVTLRGFLVNLTGSPSEADILKKLRGVPVTLTLRGGRRIHGTIIDLLHKAQTTQFGPRPLVVRANGAQPAFRQAGWNINLYTHSGLCTVPLAKVEHVRIDDPRLRRAFQHALAALAGRPNRHKRKIAVLFQGRGRRLVRFGYVMETPLWRVSYRLIIPDPDAPATGKNQPMLQALAIVANQTDMNWNDVSVHLLGGTPVSYIQDMYRPEYLPRPVQPINPRLSLLPQTYGRGVLLPQSSLLPQPMSDKLSSLRDMQQNALGGIGGGQSIFARRQISEAQSAAALPASVFQTPFNPLQGVQAVAQSGTMHPAFDYRVRHVTIARQQSAMVPILVAPITGRLLDAWVADGQTIHPMESIWLTNTTGKYLPAGPLAVMTGSTFGGDSQFAAFGQKAKRLVSFQVDTSITIQWLSDHHNTPRLISAKLKKGVLELGFHRQRILRYRLVNLSTRKKDVLIRSQDSNNWHNLAPFNTLKPRHGYDQFLTTLSPGVTKKLKIVQWNTQVTPNSLWNLTYRHLMVLAKTPGMPTTVLAMLRKAAILEKTAERRQSQADSTVAQIAQATLMEQHIRENLAALKPTVPTYNLIAAQLLRQDLIYQKLEKAQVAQNAAVATAQKALSLFLKTAQVKTTPALGVK